MRPVCFNKSLDAPVSNQAVRHGKHLQVCALIMALLRLYEGSIQAQLRRY
jgi:hypothetical protein